MKVLMAESSPNWGGQQYRLVREALWLLEHGHNVLVVCGSRSDLAAHLRQHAPRIPRQEVRTWGGVAGLLEFFWKVNRWNPDVIHTRSGQAALWASLLHVSGWNVVRSRHMTLPSRMPLREKLLFRSGCARVIASADFIKKDLTVLAGVPESRVDVSGEGVDLREFHPGMNGSGLRAELGVPPDSPLFGLVAIVRGEKGHKHFVNAAAEVLKKLPSAHFVIVGDGRPDRMERLRRRVREKFPQQPSQVILAGYRENVPEVMAALDVLVVPSLKEAQTIVIPQAFATGKPVIASLVGGIPEIVRHGENGFLVTAGDEQGLAAAMVQLAESPDLCRRLGDAALELARRTLTFDSKMELLLASYRKAMSRSSTEAAPKHQKNGGDQGAATTS